MFDLKDICFIHMSFPVKKVNCGQYLLTFSQSLLDVSLTFLSFLLKTDPIHLSRWLSLSLLCFLYDLLSFPPSVVCWVTDMPVTLPLCFPSSIFLPHHLSWQSTGLSLIHINSKTLLAAHVFIAQHRTWHFCFIFTSLNSQRKTVDSQSYEDLKQCASKHNETHSWLCHNESET